MNSVHVTGGDGYIGSNVRAVVGRPIDWYDATSVIHCAAVANIPDSIKDSITCYEVNVGRTTRLLSRMRGYAIHNIVFISTNTVEGEHPYGRSKKMCEQIIKDSGLNYAILRYFNVAGAGEGGGERRNNYRLISALIKAAVEGTPFTMYGGGTQVRDYIHVSDVADITVRAMKNLEAGGKSYTTEIGTGVGHSIKEVVAIVEKVSGRKISIIDGGVRPGDVECLIASKPDFELRHSSLENIVETAYNWHRKFYETV